MLGKLPTDYSLIFFADMAELADAQDLESCGQPCRFDPCYPHQKPDEIFRRAFDFSVKIRKNYHKSVITVKNLKNLLKTHIYAG